MLFREDKLIELTEVNLRRRKWRQCFICIYTIYIYIYRIRKK